MNDRDYLTLFNYFIGARGEHAVHIRALIHAGFEVRPDSSPRKSYVLIPATGEIIGVVVGEPESVIGKYTPTPPEPPTPEPPPPPKVSVPERKAGYKSRNMGF